jgi:ABC-type dipeptide/oligopeptide/nickel transport system ATPase subunit
MGIVGLAANAGWKPALQFSGGERQRLAIARALVVEPKLLILDESFSGLDLSIQSQIANLLMDLQQRLELTLLLISHDLALVSRLADEIAVMDRGSIIERAPAAEIMHHPRHPATRDLQEGSLYMALGEPR